MNTQHLGYVVAVADHGGFRRAAASLHVSQAALSRAIAAIEKDLGDALFVRGGRSLQLTALGEDYVAAARDILKRLEALPTASGGDGLGRGRLDVIMLATSPSSFVAEAMASFHRQHPQVLLRVAEAHNVDEVDTALVSCRADIAFTSRPTRLSGLGQATVTEEYCFVGPPDMPPPEAPVRPDTLPALPLILPKDWRYLRDASTDCAWIAAEPAAAVAEVGLRDMIIPLVLGGVGVSFLPKGSALLAARLGAVIAPLDPPITRTVTMILRPGVCSPAAAAFADHVTAGAGAAAAAGDGEAGTEPVFSAPGQLVPASNQWRPHGTG